MQDRDLTVTGWAAVPIFLMWVFVQGITALVMSLPITWLANHIFSSALIHAVFEADQLGYMQCVGLFAIWHCARARIKFTAKS